MISVRENVTGWRHTETPESNSCKHSRQGESDNWLPARTSPTDESQEHLSVGEQSRQQSLLVNARYISGVSTFIVSDWDPRNRGYCNCLGFFNSTLRLPASGRLGSHMSFPAGTRQSTRSKE
eukprot:TRINITY_DN4494_c0_g1_i4.p1 TRINITY_DN4494_c0_g1~~TRINITY_DN4494_c0_g1_i4.p1  ORF type:complete len:122 (+),score=7.30 TRINITY_DN4494_c0_g1_i4:1006-1371(+)